MKILYLVRHAKAISQGSGVNDFKRSLTKQGRNDAKAMSQRLLKKGIVLDFLISSPADRTLETAHIFAKRFDYPNHKILLKDEIYDEDAVLIKEVLKNLDDRFSTVMLFGHEPALSQLAGLFLQDTELEIRTTGVVGISLDISHWQNIAETTGNLLFFDFPVRATPKVYKKARKELAKKISATMEDILGNIDGEAAKHLEKIIGKTSKQLAKALTKVLQTSKIEDIAGIRSRTRLNNLSVQNSGQSEEPAESPTVFGDDVTQEAPGKSELKPESKTAAKLEIEKGPHVQQKKASPKATARKRRAASTSRPTKTRRTSAKQQQTESSGTQTETQDSPTAAPKRRTRSKNTASASEKEESTSP